MSKNAKVALFATIACLFYASDNVIIKRRLASIHPTATILFVHIVVVATALLAFFIFRSVLGSKFIMPKANDSSMLLLYGVLLFCADFFFLSAYQAEGSIITITTIIMLIPIFAPLIDFFLGGELPSLRQIAGWLVAVLAVYLVSSR